MYANVCKIFVALFAIVRVDSIGINGSFTCGILQALSDPTRDSKYKFGGVFLPNSGIKWYCKRKSILDKVGFKLRRFKNSFLYNDCDKNDDGYGNSIIEDIGTDNEACRIVIVNPLVCELQLK
ncbi:hypothetical protein TOT_030000735 [Theileria orientalis strain Shintoku]|uniref:Uncharacterized protein n=1 Tax=Theileria orientalis strain Shintoku TaxID=869250 RepID=J4C8W0_THEOR|nr:hypothetical protein TOT_030000735 [Theileria orientalis strain Shintoku]BAM41473.1 hypothetical protein TOT_030000735 [Theileria orientalis strain Shintoku]|eukprot:XP_009691774.1 hypothetical protein TOT_030000735 [Theileria orientalis strain Shintoku]